MLTQIVKLFLGEIVAVIASDVVDILSVLLEEAGEVGILPDRLAGQCEVVLAQVETIYVVLTRVLFSQHQVVEHHEVFAAGIEFPGVWYITPLLKEKSVDTTRVSWWW